MKFLSFSIALLASSTFVSALTPRSVPSTLQVKARHHVPSRQRSLPVRRANVPATLQTHSKRQVGGECGGDPTFGACPNLVDTCCPLGGLCCDAGGCCEAGFYCTEISGQSACCPEGTVCGEIVNPCEVQEHLPCAGRDFCCAQGFTCTIDNCVESTEEVELTCEIGFDLCAEEPGVERGCCATGEVCVTVEGQGFCEDPAAPSVTSSAAPPNRTSEGVAVPNISVGGNTRTGTGTTPAASDPAKDSGAFKVTVGAFAGFLPVMAFVFA